MPQAGQYRGEYTGFEVIILIIGRLWPAPSRRLSHTGQVEASGRKDATRFLTGVTLEEIEAQADRLVRLGAVARPSQEPALDLSTTARAAKAERRRGLLAVLTGRSEQPCDSAGRYVSRGFDGGEVSLCQLPAMPNGSTVSWSATWPASPS